MMLADLLLGGDLDREPCVVTGVGMIAIDSLMHNHLHRTGILGRFGSEHAYGDTCDQPDGCAALLDGLALRIDARKINPEFPVYFPRFVQHALWRFCAGASWTSAMALGLSIVSGARTVTARRSEIAIGCSRGRYGWRGRS